jgi:aspartyl-tRNA(Asn)/glutamyl-tRNA(Gln) amidotransferase subunit C
MAITREQVLHVAKLAHLDLTDEEVDRFREQLSAILDAVSKVSELDLADVPPTSHPLELVNVWRDDEPGPATSSACRRPARYANLDRHPAPDGRGSDGPARA